MSRNDDEYEIMRQKKQTLISIGLIDNNWFLRRKSNICVELHPSSLRRTGRTPHGQDLLALILEFLLCHLFFNFLRVHQQWCKKKAYSLALLSQKPVIFTMTSFHPPDKSCTARFIWHSKSILRARCFSSSAFSFQTNRLNSWQLLINTVFISPDGTVLA